MTIADGEPRSNSMDIYVNFTNSPPYFNETMPLDLNLRFNTTYLITLPPFHDNETNPIFINVTTTPPFNISEIIQVVYPNKLNITANKWEQLGIYPINITLTDTNKWTTYTFTMTVYNEPPRF